MRTSFARRRGFTLIELLVSIAIMVTLAGIAAPALYENLNAGDLVKCRTNLENLHKLGVKYGQDMSHANILPTSGMGDDEDTGVNENDGWWVSLAEVDDDAVVPTGKDAKVKLSSMYRCPGDNRAKVQGDKFVGGTKTVSYVSWTDGSADRTNPYGAIRTTAKQNLDTLPWLSDGNPLKGKSVNSLENFKKMVMPTIPRHKNTIMVVYASGIVKAIEVDEDKADAAQLFKRIAPSLRADGPKVKDKVEDAEDDDSEEDAKPASAGSSAADDDAEEPEPEPEDED